jgi:hypothetical protein
MTDLLEAIKAGDVEQTSAIMSLGNQKPANLLSGLLSGVVRSEAY